MGKWILAILGAVHASVTPIAASSDSGVWTNREICRAAVKTYFFLDAKPTDTADSGQYFGFLSASGNVYTCRIEDTRAEFRWLNASGQTMTSKSTRFHVRAGMLTVYTDMVTTRPFLFLGRDLAFWLLRCVDQVRGVTGEGDLDGDERVVTLGGGGLQVA